MRFACLAVAAGALGFAQPSLAAHSSGQTSVAAPRIAEVIIYGRDACPPSSVDEIKLCLRLPEGDRQRISPHPTADAVQAAWNRAVELSYVGRGGTESCERNSTGFISCRLHIESVIWAERPGANADYDRLVDEVGKEREARLRAATQDELRDATQEEQAAERSQPD